VEYFKVYQLADVLNPVGGFAAFVIGDAPTAELVLVQIVFKSNSFRVTIPYQVTSGSLLCDVNITLIVMRGLIGRSHEHLMDNFTFPSPALSLEKKFFHQVYEWFRLQYPLASIITPLSSSSMILQGHIVSTRWIIDMRITIRPSPNS